MGDKMDKSKKQFLQLLRVSLFGGDLEFQDNENIKWDEIYELSEIHKVIPMIYEVICNLESFQNYDEKLQDQWQSMSNTTSFGQMHKTNRFLALYKELAKKNIRPIILKGLTLSLIYPNEYKRNYMNEEMLIKEEDLEECEQILVSNGFERKVAKEGKEGIYIYHCDSTGLFLHIHTCLFDDNIKFEEVSKDIFENVWEDEDGVVLNINGVDIHTLSIDKHLLYIIFSAINDLKNNSMRIRQICDIIMYINSYHYKINWNFIWRKISNIGLENLLVDFLQIGIEELGLNEGKITYPRKKSSYNINTIYLLEEILGGGFYGNWEEEYLDNELDDELLDEVDYFDTLLEEKNYNSFFKKSRLLLNKVFAL